MKSKLSEENFCKEIKFSTVVVYVDEHDDDCDLHTTQTMKEICAIINFEMNKNYFNFIAWRKTMHGQKV